MDIQLLIANENGHLFRFYLMRSRQGDLRWVETRTGDRNDGTPVLRTIKTMKYDPIYLYHYYDFEQTDMEAFK